MVGFNSYIDGQLTRLSQLENCSVEPGDPDPRGWIVFMSDGPQVGTVIDLLVDHDEMNVRYLVVDVDGGALPGVSESGRTALLSIEDVDLDGGLRRVTARAFACDDIHAVRRTTAPTVDSEKDQASVGTV